MYHLAAGITDVRVCHPCCGEVCFIVTFLSARDRERFDSGPRRDAEIALSDVVEGGTPIFSTTGTLMPAAHTLTSLLEWLTVHVVGGHHSAHDVRAVSRELAKWFPRPSEWSKFATWNKADPNKYTRNVVLQNDNMDVLLMCWPPGTASTIHDHDDSSCWVCMVEGEVHEVQFELPRLDRKFLESEMRNPTGATGRCGQLRPVKVTKLEPGGCSSSYANNDIGVHRVENRSETARAPAARHSREIASDHSCCP